MTNNLKSTQKLCTVSEVNDLVAKGRSLVLAGHASALEKVQQGNWIGGTSSYFTATDKSLKTNELIFVTDISDLGTISLKCYSEKTLKHIPAGVKENGFSIVIIPSGSECLAEFSKHAADYEDAFTKPMVGWVSGVDLAESGTSPMVFLGFPKEKMTNYAVVAHVELPADQSANLGIVNIFEADETSDEIEFFETNSVVEYCKVNGEKVLFKDYLAARDLTHGKQPLIGDFGGASLNVSIKEIKGTKVILFAPVQQGIIYKTAKRILDYKKAFEIALSKTNTASSVFSCNCILNYLHGEFEDHVVDNAPQGPITFGEIAYKLLNQTQVYVEIL